MAGWKQLFILMGRRVLHPPCSEPSTERPTSTPRDAMMRHAEHFVSRPSREAESDEASGLSAAVRATLKSKFIYLSRLEIAATLLSTNGKCCCKAPDARFARLRYRMARYGLRQSIQLQTRICYRQPCHSIMNAISEYCTEDMWRIITRSTSFLEGGSECIL